MILVTKNNVYINCYNICTAGSVDETTIMVNNQLISFENTEEKDEVLKNIKQYLEVTALEGVRYL